MCLYEFCYFLYGYLSKTVKNIGTLGALNAAGQISEYEIGIYNYMKILILEVTPTPKKPDATVMARSLLVAISRPGSVVAGHLLDSVETHIGFNYPGAVQPDNRDGWTSGVKATAYRKTNKDFVIKSDK
jgi:hypothetical protein